MSTTISIKGKGPAYRPVRERILDYRDVAILREEPQSQQQASQCLSCAVPFCHWRCPLGNYIPDWNRSLAEGRWEEAYLALARTNNLPEVTGRLCPAPCESACILEFNDGAVASRENELAIIEYAFRTGYVRPNPPERRTGRRVAIVGSGPAGLSCAAQLNQAGHRVVVFERDDKIGGILRYGIPDFKLEKWVIDRRLRIWEAEGIEFAVGVHVGADLTFPELLKEFDAVCLAGGSRLPRDLHVEGRNLRGIHFAMEYLTQSNRRVAGESIPPDQLIDAKGKQVVVVGGGDTGSDCVGTAHRQGAAKVVQMELLPRPPETRRPEDRWPNYPTVLRTSSSHEEGGERRWSVLTKRFLGEGGRVKKLFCAQAECAFSKQQGLEIREIQGTEFEIEADLVLLAMGFVSPEQVPWLDRIGIQRDGRGNVKTDSRHHTSVEKVFAAGDMRRGQSLIAWAIHEGREAAHYMDCALMSRSILPLMA